MEKKTITFRADGQILWKTDTCFLFASNIVSYINAEFTLGDNWTGFDAVRAVWKTATDQVSMVLDEGGKCEVPAEVLRYPSKVLVNLVGSTVVDGVLQDRLTTYPCHAFTIDQSAHLEGGETPNVTPSLFEQFVSMVKGYWEDIHDYKRDAEAWAIGKRNGDPVAEDDDTYQNNSKYYADQANESAQQAHEDLITLNEHIAENVDEWLVAHPEATTTVQDGSLTEAKFTDALKLKAIKDYVTPEMFGAKGDGITDDTSSIQDALDYSVNNHLPLIFLAKTYIVSETITINITSGKWLEISGQGFLSKIKTATSFSGDYVFSITCSDSAYKGTQIKGFRIESNSQAGGIYVTGAIGQSGLFEDIWFEDLEQSTLKNGIYCVSACGNTFRRVVMRNIKKGCGVVLAEHHTNWVSECDFYYCQYGVYLGGGTNLTVEKCRIDEGEYGIYCNGAESIMTDSRLFPFLSTLTNCRFIGNRFEHNTKYAIVLIAYSNLYMQHQGIIIESNYFDTLSVANGTKGIVLGRVFGIVIRDNSFKGDVYNSSTPGAKNQNVESAASVSDIAFYNNKAILVTDGGGGYYKSNSYISQDLCNPNGLIQDIEVNQSTRIDSNNNRNYYNISAATITNNTLDASSGNVFFIPDGATINTISCSTVGLVRQAKEITLIFLGAGTVQGGTSSINLNGNANFIATQYSTLTLIGGYAGADRWFEKGRSIK